jgi:glycopeptide antibiotics resistance protein
VTGLVVWAPRLVFGVVWLGLVLFLRLRRKTSLTYLMFFSVFCFYLYMVLDYTVLQFQSLLLMRYLSPDIIVRGVDAGQNLNLVPLVTLSAADIQTSLLNVVMMLPFGFGLPFITSLRLGKVVGAAALLSLTIEFVQFATGYAANATFRVADVNDVLFNTAGAALGYLLFVAFIRLYRRALGDWQATSSPLLRYVAARPQIDA